MTSSRPTFCLDLGNDGTGQTDTVGVLRPYHEHVGRVRAEVADHVGGRGHRIGSHDPSLEIIIL